MTPDEFSLEFDVLYNNIMSNQAPGLNGYEKSLFLTEAQESVVLDAYAGRLSGAPFETIEETRAYLSPLVEQKTFTGSAIRLIPDAASGSFGGKSYRIDIPEEVWFKTGETALVSNSSLECKDNAERIVDVVPVTQDMWYRTVSSPFRNSNERRILRMDIDRNTVELYSKYPVQSYTVRYLRRPEPIILEPLDQYGVTINGTDNMTGCELNEVLHRPILLKAVQLAKMAWSS